MKPEDAQLRVYEFVSKGWSDVHGTLHIGVPKEDSMSFYVPWGAREWMVDNDDNYVLLDAPLIFVDKATGAISEHLLFDVWDRVNAMREIG